MECPTAVSTWSESVQGWILTRQDGLFRSSSNVNSSQPWNRERLHLQPGEPGVKKWEYGGCFGWVGFRDSTVDGPAPVDR